MAAVYDCLRAFPPFSRMKLPAADAIEFHVTRHTDRFGHYTRVQRSEQHELAVSTRHVGAWDTLVLTVAHEMIHLYQGVKKSDNSNTQHNAEFRKIARQVCRRFAWDFKQFI